MDAAIRAEFSDAHVELICGGSGNFIVIADGKQLWDKRNMDNNFPENTEILAAIHAR